MIKTSVDKEEKEYLTRDIKYSLLNWSITEAIDYYYIKEVGMNWLAETMLSVLEDMATERLSNEDLDAFNEEFEERVLDSLEVDD